MGCSVSVVFGDGPQGVLTVTSVNDGMRVRVGWVVVVVVVVLAWSSDGVVCDIGRGGPLNHDRAGWGGEA